MGTSKTTPNTWLGLDGNGKTSVNNVFATAAGWCIKHPNGQIELLQAMSGCGESPPNSADVYQAVNPDAGEYSIIAGDTLIFVINWSEPVIITGTPQISFEENGAAQTADYVVSASSSVQSIFTFDVTTIGVVDTVTTTIGLNGGTITGADSINATVDLTFTNDTVTATEVDVAGAGYDGTETIAYDTPNKINSTATVTTTDNGGALETVVLEDGGYGYADGEIAVTGGTNGTVDITTVDGVIVTVAINVAGTGYTGASGVDLAGPTLTVIAATGSLSFAQGRVTAITTVTPGYGYDGTEGATIDDPTGTPAVLTFDTGYTQPVGVVVVA